MNENLDTRVFKNSHHVLAVQLDKATKQFGLNFEEAMEPDLCCTVPSMPVHKKHPCATGDAQRNSTVPNAIAQPKSQAP